MKPTLLIITLVLTQIFLLSSNIASGEKKNTTIELLCKNIWQEIIPANYKSIIENTLTFTKKQTMYNMKFHSKFKKTQEYNIIYEYYLSETPDTSFDQTKVGKIKNGKYLIVRAYNRNEIYRIHKLTSTYLKIELIGGATFEYIIKGKTTNQTAKKATE